MKRNHIPIAGAILSFVLLAGCSKLSSASTQPAKEEPRKTATANEVDASPSLMERVKVGEVPWGEAGGSLTVAARAAVDESRVSRVGSPVMGRIMELNVQEGQEVKRGQLLAVLNSTGLSEAQLSLLKALSQVQLAERSVDRANQLLAAGVIGSAELKRREGEMAQATADVTAARDQLSILGMPQEQIERLEKTRMIDSVARVTATMDGIVMSRKVAVGQIVQPADTLAEIADLSSLWLEADVPEENSGTLVKGREVETELAAFAGQKLRGRLSYVSATVNPETRTVRVRMDLANPSRQYKPAMLATMVLKDPSQRKQIVPGSAVVRDGNQEIVFVEAGPSKFVLRPVTLGGDPGGDRVLLGGLQPRERIVVDGAFHVNNERIRLSMQGE